MTPGPGQGAGRGRFDPALVAVIARYALKACFPTKRRLGLLLPAAGALLFAFLSQLLPDRAPVALAQVAGEQGRVAPVAVRVNPDVEAHTHPYITTGTRATKFGVPPALARALIHQAAAHPALRPLGLHAHVGSQLLQVQPIIAATARLLDLWDALAAEGILLHELDIGGGLGIAYRPDDTPEGPGVLAAGLRPLLAGRTLDLVLEK